MSSSVFQRSPIIIVVDDTKNVVQKIGDLGARIAAFVEIETKSKTKKHVDLLLLIYLKQVKQVFNNQLGMTA